MTVAELLRDSKAAHEKAKSLRRAGKKEEAREALILARALRVEALGQDRDREDPAWRGEQGKTNVGSDTHTALMEFYDDQLSRPVRQKKTDRAFDESERARES